MLILNWKNFSGGDIKLAQRWVHWVHVTLIENVTLSNKTRPYLRAGGPQHAEVWKSECEKKTGKNEFLFTPGSIKDQLMQKVLFF